MTAMRRTMLCGPMTGNYQKDWLVFKDYEDRARRGGINVVNPLRIIDQHWEKMGKFDKPVAMPISKSAWVWYSDIQIVLDELGYCDSIFLMKNWKTAINSLMVGIAAQAMGLKLLYFEDEETLVNNAASANDSNATAYGEWTKAPEATVRKGDDDDDDYKMTDEEYDEMSRDLTDKEVEELSKRDKDIDDAMWLDKQLKRDPFKQRGGFDAGKD